MGKRILIFYSLLFCLFAQPLWAENEPITYKQFNHYFATLYVNDFVREYNAFTSTKQLKSEYKYLFDSKDRELVMKGWTEMPKAKADGTAVVFTLKGKQTLRIEMVDFLAQNFKINGRTFTNDWNGDTRLQRELLMKLVTEKRQASLPGLWTLAVPEAQAQTGVEDAAIIAMICAGGLCEGGITAAEMLLTRGALLAVEDEAAITTAARAVGSKTATGAKELLEKAGEKAGKIGKAFLKDFKEDPESKAAYKKLMENLEGLKHPSRWVWGPFNLVRGILKNPYTQISIGSGSMFYINNYANEAAKHNIKFQEAAWCALTQKTISECEKADPKMQVSIVPAPGLADDTYCPTKRANEFQYVEKEKDGKSIVRVIRAKVTDDKDKSGGVPITAIRFELNMDNSVDASTIRYFDMKDGKVSAVYRPQFKQNKFNGTDIVIRKRDYANPVDVESDVANQIAHRDEILKNMELARPESIGGEALDKYAFDALGAKTNSALAAMDTDVLEAKDIDQAYMIVAKKTCQVVKEIQADTAKATVDAALTKKEDGTSSK